MDVRTITLQYLQQNGFDGLYLEEICGCKLSNLFACGGCRDALDCEPGYIRQTHDGWIITPNKVPPTPTPPNCTCPSGDGSLRWPCPAHPPTP